MKKLIIDGAKFDDEDGFYCYLIDNIIQNCPTDYPNWRADLFYRITQELYDDNEDYEDLYIEWINFRFNKSVFSSKEKESLLDSIINDFSNFSCCDITSFTVID